MTTAEVILAAGLGFSFLGIVVVQTITVLVALIVPVFQWFTSAEQRRRELEDRQEVIKQAKIASDANVLAAHGVSKTMEIVHAAVIEVGQKATDAYTEANFANKKIQAVQDVLTTQLGLPHEGITASTGAGKENIVK